VQTVLVTGVAGNLGMRLLPQLAGFRVVGVDIRPAGSDPNAATASTPAMDFHAIDLGREQSSHELVDLLFATQASAVVHLAFVIDPVRSGVLDVARQWQINVAGTARVMEAIGEYQRRGGGPVEKFIFPSSVSAYGPETPALVKEDFPLGGHTLPYAIHKREADQVAQLRASWIEPCHTYILRPHIFVGASVQNYLVGALRGTATGAGERARKLRERGTRLPMLLPRGEKYREKKYQFVHVDDMARLIAWLLRAPVPAQNPTILNVAARGDTITLARCAEIGHAEIKAVPGKWLCRLILRAMWRLGISGFPPEALPYMIGSFTMDTTRLRDLLGQDYERVMQYTVESALADSFEAPPAAVPAAQPQESRV